MPIYNSPSGDGAVDSVNTQTGVVVLDQDDIGDGSSYVQTENNYTDAEKIKLTTLKATAEIVLSALGGTPSTTSGCAAVANRELATNDVEINYLAFDKDSDEYCQWSIVMPNDYNGGTITAKIYWTAISDGGNAHDVDWYIQGQAFGDSDTLDNSWGSAVAITSDVLDANDDLQITAVSGAITFSNTPVAGDMINIRVYRDGANDTLDDDAQLLMVKLLYTRS